MEQQHACALIPSAEHPAAGPSMSFPSDYSPPSTPPLPTPLPMPSAPSSNSVDLKTWCKRKARKSKKKPAKKEKRAWISKKGNSLAVTSNGLNPSDSGSEEPPTDDEDFHEPKSLEEDPTVCFCTIHNNMSTAHPTASLPKAPCLLKTRDSLPLPQDDTAHLPSFPHVSQLTTGSIIIINSDPSWPEWFCDGHDLLTTKDLSNRFTTAINSYIQLESHTSFQAGLCFEGFKPTNRLSEVAWWVAWGQKVQPTVLICTYLSNSGGSGGRACSQFGTRLWVSMAR